MRDGQDSRREGPDRPQAGGRDETAGDGVAPFEAVAERKEITIKIDARIARAGVVRDLATLVKDFPGDSRVNLVLEMSEGTKEFVLGPQYKVKPVPDFFAEAKALLGETAVL